MHFPQTAEYALRAMAAIAAHAPGTAARASDLSEVTGIPQPYLSKILRRLVMGRLLTSQRGHGGGFVLSRPAAEIQFRDILDAMDYFATDSACVYGWAACDTKHPCPLHDTWAALKAQFERWASEATLASVQGSPTKHATTATKSGRAALVQLAKPPAPAARPRR